MYLVYKQSVQYSFEKRSRCPRAQSHQRSRKSSKDADRSYSVGYMDKKCAFVLALAYNIGDRKAKLRKKRRIEAKVHASKGSEPERIKKRGQVERRSSQP